MQALEESGLALSCPLQHGLCQRRLRPKFGPWLAVRRQTAPFMGQLWSALLVCVFSALSPCVVIGMMCGHLRVSSLASRRLSARRLCLLRAPCASCCPFENVAPTLAFGCVCGVFCCLCFNCAPLPLVRPWGGAGGKSFRVTLLIQSSLTLSPVVASGPNVTLCGTAGPLPTSLHPHVDRLTRPFILHRVACKDMGAGSRGDGLTPAFVGMCAGEAFAHAPRQWQLVAAW
jgi:hypothetical protein